MSDPLMKEVLDRCRRMETRLTRFLESQGFDTKARRPTFVKGMLFIPSMACSIQDCVAAIPSDERGKEVGIYHQDDFIGYIRTPAL
jgi:hypothetical protein